MEPTNHPWKERKMIWTKPPWNYVPALNLRGCTHFGNKHHLYNVNVINGRQIVQIISPPEPKAWISTSSIPSLPQPKKPRDFSRVVQGKVFPPISNKWAMKKNPDSGFYVNVKGWYNVYMYISIYVYMYSLYTLEVQPSCLRFANDHFVS